MIPVRCGQNGKRLPERAAFFRTTGFQFGFYYLISMVAPASVS